MKYPNHIVPLNLSRSQPVSKIWCKMVEKKYVLIVDEDSRPIYRYHSVEDFMVKMKKLYLEYNPKSSVSYHDNFKEVLLSDKEMSSMTAPHFIQLVFDSIYDKDNIRLTVAVQDKVV